MGRMDRRCSLKMRQRKGQAAKKERIKRRKPARAAVHAEAMQTKKPRTSKPASSAAS